jgi:hypothetical protein
MGVVQCLEIECGIYCGRYLSTFGTEDGGWGIIDAGKGR